MRSGPRSRRWTVATVAELNVRVADVEPVKSALGSAAEFVKAWTSLPASVRAEIEEIDPPLARRASHLAQSLLDLVGRERGMTAPDPGQPAGRTTTAGTERG